MSLEDKIRAYMGSDKGKSIIKNGVREKKKKLFPGSNGGIPGGSDDYAASVRDADMLARKLAELILYHATRDDVPASVLKDMEMSLNIRPIGENDDSIRIDMSFTGNLHRQSLCPDDYDGINNIIALFNNGYVAGNYVYGFWDNHSYTGEYNLLRSDFNDNFAFVRSRISRPSLGFMQTAIHEFIETYDKYDVKVELDGIYDGESNTSY